MLATDTQLITLTVDRDDLHSGLMAGTRVLIDPDKRKPIAGECYLVRWSNGRTDLCRVSPCSHIIGNVVAHNMGRKSLQVSRVHTAQQFSDAIHKGVPYPHWTDNSTSSEHLGSKLVGQVVDVCQPLEIGAMAQ
mgnify:CR=1 FL=1